MSAPAHPSLLVTGGARSGKSRFAAEWIRARSAHPIYLATAQSHHAADDDDEMAARIARHQADRLGQGWRTVEEPLAVVEAIATNVANADQTASQHGNALLVDCATLWLCNLGEALAWDDRAILARVDALADLLRDPPCALAVVTNEVGSGIVPTTPLGRHFLDLQGWTNQRLAAAAQEAVLLVCGLPLWLRRPDGNP